MLTKTLLFISLISLTPITLAYAQDKGLEHKARAETLFKQYFDCVTSYSQKLAVNNLSATATEIAIASRSECEVVSLHYKNAMYEYSRSNISELRSRDFSEKVTENLRSRGNELAINQVLKIRATTGTQ